MWYNLDVLGVAQLVARSVWDAEVARSNRVAQTIQNTYLGVAQLVARAVRDCEVVSSSLITQTKINSPCLGDFWAWRSGSAHAWGA